MDETVLDFRDTFGPGLHIDSIIQPLLLSVGLLDAIEIPPPLEAQLANGVAREAGDNSDRHLTLRDLRRTGRLGEVDEMAQQALLGGILCTYDANGCLARQAPIAPSSGHSDRPETAPLQQEQWWRPGTAATLAATWTSMASTADSATSVEPAAEPPRDLDGLRSTLRQLLRFEPAADTSPPLSPIAPGMTLPSAESTLRPNWRDSSQPLDITLGASTTWPAPAGSPVRDGNLSTVDEGTLPPELPGTVGLNATNSASMNQLHGEERALERRQQEDDNQDDADVSFGHGTLSSTLNSDASVVSLRAGSMTLHARTMLRRLAAIDEADIEDSLARSVRRVVEMGVALAGGRLSDDEIAALPKVNFEEDEQQCSVCLEAYKPGELLTELPCGHFFHVDCIAGWFQRSSQCPLCRAEV